VVSLFDELSGSVGGVPGSVMGGLVSIWFEVSTIVVPESEGALIKQLQASKALPSGRQL